MQQLTPWSGMLRLLMRVATLVMAGLTVPVPAH
jgi:hypothetical protein